MLFGVFPLQLQFLTVPRRVTLMTLCREQDSTSLDNLFFMMGEPANNLVGL